MASSNIYQKLILTDSVNLTPRDINFNIDNVIKEKIKKKTEGKCIKEGYVKKDSVEIVNRSSGYLVNSNFAGIVNYSVKYSAEVCMLSKNQIIECDIYSIDKSQIICYIGDKDNSPVEVYLNKQHHIGNEQFHNLNIKDRIKVKVSGIYFEFKDTQIIAIAEFIDKVY
jgi:DNA-directed RNA polymerase subunit E'/Rpb7